MAHGDCERDHEWKEEEELDDRYEDEEVSRVREDWPTKPNSKFIVLGIAYTTDLSAKLLPHIIFTQGSKELILSGSKLLSLLREK